MENLVESNDGEVFSTEKALVNVPYDHLIRILILVYIIIKLNLGMVRTILVDGLRIGQFFLKGELLTTDPDPCLWDVLHNLDLCGKETLQVRHYWTCIPGAYDFRGF